MVTLAMRREWPDKEFVEQVKAAFPDQGMANVEEARVSTNAKCLEHVSSLITHQFDMLEPQQCMSPTTMKTPYMFT